MMHSTWRRSGCRRTGVALLLAFGLAFQLAGCNRRTAAYVPPEEEPPGPERPVSIPTLAQDRPSMPMPSRGGAPVQPQASAPRAGEAEDAPPIQGALRLGDGVEAPSTGVIFVIVRSGQGPPLAVQRLSIAPFPMAFQVGPGDVMMQGRPFEGDLAVTARLDVDGNPMTQGPQDLVGGLDELVRPGATGLEIVLRPADR